MTEEVQAVNETEMKTFQIGDKVYDADSITEKGVNIINDVRKVDAKLADHQLTVSIMQLAKAKLMEELDKEVQNFTEVKEEAK